MASCGLGGPGHTYSKPAAPEVLHAWLPGALGWEGLYLKLLQLFFGTGVQHL